MESIAIDITDFTNKSELFTQDLLKRGIDLTKPFKVIATTIIVPSFQQNFMEQGRPEKWKPLKPETIIARYYRRNKGKGLVSKKMRGMKSVGSARYKESSAGFLENAQILIKILWKWEVKKFTLRLMIWEVIKEISTHDPLPLSRNKMPMMPTGL